MKYEQTWKFSALSLVYQLLIYPEATEWNQKVKQTQIKEEVLGFVFKKKRKGESIHTVEMAPLLPTGPNCDCMAMNGASIKTFMSCCVTAVELVLHLMLYCKEKI